MAIEHLLANAFRIIYDVAEVSDQEIANSHARLRSSLKTETIPGIDPALSDLWAAEIEDALSQLLSLISEVRSTARNRR